jgi:hypothetical protein
LFSRRIIPEAHWYSALPVWISGAYRQQPGCVAGAGSAPEVAKNLFYKEVVQQGYLNTKSFPDLHKML